MIKTKDPDALVDYSVNWSRWLDGDEIASSTWLVPAGLTNEGEDNTTTTATIWLSGGTIGTSYTVTNRITTVAGRTDDRSFTLTIAER